MPRHQPFTFMCQQVAKLSRPVVADLHTHTTASDGDYTPSQLVATAWRAGLNAVAITDHDTMAGIAEATEAARQFTSRPISVVPGVEISTLHEGRSYHLLGYFVDEADFDLMARLSQIQQGRKARFYALADQLAREQVNLDRTQLDALAERTSSLGRRHLAGLLLQAGIVPTRGEAFRRYLARKEFGQRIEGQPELSEAIALVARSGGLSSLAHPPSEMTFAELESFANLGLHSVEASFSRSSLSRTQEVRRWCRNLKLAWTGGSDCHGPEGSLRMVGSCGLNQDDWQEFHRRVPGAQRF